MSDNKNNNINISQELADQMLQNIFEACDVSPNTVALEELETYTAYRRDRFKLRKVLTAFILVLFIFVPFLFLSPEIVSVQQTPDSDPTYNISVESFIPVVSVTATVNGKNVPVVEKQKGVYTLQPGEEGIMNVKITTLNRQYITKKIHVTSVDNVTPFVVDSMRDGDKFYLYVDDNISGVDYETVYAQGADSKKIMPIQIDEKKGMIVFKYPSESINIFISDMAGNQLQLLLTI